MEIFDCGASFNEDRTCRYTLWRKWDSRKGMVAFVGLNPSTANETVNDPTVRRCINFARKWGYGGIYMLNIFAYRATDPSEMKKQEHLDLQDNIEKIVEVARECDLVVGCWGVHGSFMGQGKKVVEVLGKNGIKLYCLGITKDGHPKHPLYLRGDLKPVLFEEALDE